MLPGHIDDYLIKTIFGCHLGCLAEGTYNFRQNNGKKWGLREFRHKFDSPNWLNVKLAVSTLDAWT